MNRNDKQSNDTLKQVIVLILSMMLLSGLLPGRAEDMIGDEAACEDLFEEDWGDAVVILEDPEFIMFDDEEEEAVFPEVPVITSVGRSNVKVNGMKSKGRLVRYTIPEALLLADEDFLALMTEAEKYIGYPYVYGGSSPATSFDCSGFVCWVFTHAGVYDTGRLGAKGLYAICEDVPADAIRPGDLVFFENTMGPDVKGITHVGIYIGNNMMIHAGDPIGFADLKSASWARKIYAYGRLPID
ncbi:MAG: C40 family peptidase [Acidaminococcaceae bacterium]|nr:C40 family peptidase [Acidaminococcaceae bacterium]